jgi:hypothetical protein
MRASGAVNANVFDLLRVMTIRVQRMTRNTQLRNKQRQRQQPNSVAGDKTSK